MKALILAAGYGVRLYPLTKRHPKPLLKVGSKPLVDYLIKKLEAIEEIDEIIIVTNSKFMPVFKKWRLKKKGSKKISLLDDLTSSVEDRRGAIGDIEFSISRKNIRDDLLVIGGDNLFDEPLNDFFSFSKDNYPHPVIGVYDIKKVSLAHKYGLVKLNNHSQITSFKEKPKKASSTLVAMCLYYFPKDKLRLIREFLKKHKNDATGFYIDWLRKKIQVYGFIFGGRWFDIGDHKFYNKAKSTFSN